MYTSFVVFSPGCYKNHPFWRGDLLHVWKRREASSEERCHGHCQGPGGPRIIRVTLRSVEIFIYIYIYIYMCMCVCVTLYVYIYIYICIYYLIMIIDYHQIVIIIHSWKWLGTWWEDGWYPLGKRLHDYGKSPLSMGKLTMSMTIFNSYIKW